LQGTETLYMIHIPTFNVANHRQQLIVQIDIDEESKKKYLKFKNDHPTKPMVLVTNPIQLPKLLNSDDHFSAQIKEEKTE